MVIEEKGKLPRLCLSTEDAIGFACDIAHNTTIEHFNAIHIPYEEDDGESLTYTKEAQRFFDEWYDYIHYKLQNWSSVEKKEEK